MSELHDTVEDAKDDFKNWFDNDNQWADPGEEIAECAESSISVYTSDRLRLALDNLSFATTEPDIPADNASDMIAFNAIQYVAEKLHEYHEKLKEEWEEEEYQRELDEEAEEDPEAEWDLA